MVTDVEKDLSKLLGIPFDPYDLKPRYFRNGEFGPLKEPLHMEACPCCGGEPLLGLVSLYSFYGWIVKCKACGIRTLYEAIDKPSLRPSGVEGIARVDESTRYTSAQAAEIVISKWNHRPAAAV